MATLAEKLADAETAYHALMTGRQVRVFVDQNGERVEYSAVTAAKLAQYITDLKRQISGARLGPMRISF